MTFRLDQLLDFVQKHQLNSLPRTWVLLRASRFPTWYPPRAISLLHVEMIHLWGSGVTKTVWVNPLLEKMYVFFHLFAKRHPSGNSSGYVVLKRTS